MVFVSQDLEGFVFDKWNSSDTRALLVFSSSSEHNLFRIIFTGETLRTNPSVQNKVDCKERLTEFSISRLTKTEQELRTKRK